MHTEINYHFTPSTLETLLVDENVRINLPAPNLSVVPLPGDFFSLEELLPHNFIVKSRTFHWKSKEHLQIFLELDLYTDEDHFVRTGLVR